MDIKKQLFLKQDFFKKTQLFSWLHLAKEQYTNRLANYLNNVIHMACISIILRRE